MQVEGFFRKHSRIATVLGTGALVLTATMGCNRAPAPDVVAMVNGKEIKRADLEKIYQANREETPQEPSAEQADMVRLNILRTMIDDEILQERAAKLNLAASDEDVNARLTEMKAPYTQEEFDRKLKQRNITVDDLKRDIRRGLTQTKLINKEIESKINITDAEIASYYNAHKSEFNFIEPQYHLAQIVVSGNPPQQGANLQNRRPPNEAEARKEIQTIHNRLESGEDFGALAAQFSENPNYASNGGDMGFVAESQLRNGDQEAFNAISKLRPGQITDPLPVYDGEGPGHRVAGYMIFKLINRQAAGQWELSDPRTQQSIRSALRQRKTQLLQNAYMEVLHDQAKVRNYFAEQVLKQGAQ